jgi:hypothetical protein
MKLGMMFIASLVLVSGLAASAQQYSRPLPPFTPVDLGSTDTCLIPRVEGERVPFPLQKANTHFELAAGETYLLNGTLAVMNGKVFLKLDFNSQPWLATDRMVSYPYIEVSSIDPNTARSYGGRIVQVAVVAGDNDTAHGVSRPMDLKLRAFLPPTLAR